MIILNAATDLLRVVTSTAATVDVFCTYADLVGAAVTVGYTQNLIVAAGTYTMVAGVASTSRNVKAVNVCNRSTTLQSVVTVFMSTATGDTRLRNVPLDPGESLAYDDQVGWQVYDAVGRIETNNGNIVPPISTTYPVYKVGTAAEAAGVEYCFGKDTGSPGAWSPGTPGLNGRATDGTAAGDVGGVPLVATAAGKKKTIKSMSGGATQVGFFRLLDILWVNTGLVVTTTTIQSLASVALPARDLRNSINGEGCLVGLLVTAATTNAAAVTTITLSYTSSAGVVGRTATMASFPATANVGSVVWFQLQAGDIGVQSIQGITLGTSLVTGSVSIIVAMAYGSAISPVANFPCLPVDTGNVFVPEKACLLLSAIPAGATATTASLQITMQDL